MYKIYLIINKINDKKYIGQTKQKLKSRFNGHKTKSNKGSKTAFHNAIRKYGIENFDIILLETVQNIELSSQREIELIKKYDTLVPKGYNTLEGGLNCQFARKNKNLTIEHKIKIQNSHKKNSKPIIQFDIATGNFIKEWNSGKELLRNGLTRQNIINLCKSKQMFGYIYGFGWCYKKYYESLDNKLILSNPDYNPHGRTIKCLDTNNNIIKIYYKIKDAAKDLDCSPSSIQDCIQGRTKTCKGYKWEYV